MQTDALIQLLVDEVSPVRALAPPWRRAGGWLAISLASLVLVIAFLSPDPARIANIRAQRFWLEQIAALTTGFAAAAAAMSSIVPGRSRRAWSLPLAPLGLWIGVIVWGCVLDWAQRGAAGLVIRSDWPCVVAMIVAAVLPAMLIMGMLRRGAPLAPRAAAALAGLAVAGLSSATACLSRPSPHGTTATVLVWHFGVLLAMIGGAVIAGRHLHAWPVTRSLAGRFQ